MKKNFSLFFPVIFCLLFSLLYQPSVSAADPVSSSFLLSNSTLGTDFWLAIPQNEDPRAALAEEGLEILVTSIYNCDVTVQMPDVGFASTRHVEAFKLTTFNTKNQGAQFGWVVSESEMVENKGVHVTSTAPIAVYVIVVKYWSSDGYMAVPVAGWGTNYYHCSYYDDHENNRDRGGGFIIVAATDNTRVDISLDGTGSGTNAATDGGRKIGATINVSLKKGQTYMVKGNGKTAGQFDLSGTHISSNYPVGFIPFHVRTCIPSNPAQSLSRDNLCEMIPPVSRWGKQFVSNQLTRKKVGSRKGDGDMFRVVASEDNTKVSCSFFSSSTGEKLGTVESVLKKAGDIFEPFNIMDIAANNNAKTSVRGVSVWNADKPVMLMQYAWSSNWDGDVNWDPMQMYIPPIEQYLPSAVVLTPSVDLDFNNNELNLFAVGDPGDPKYTLLKTIKIDGQEVWRKDSKILINLIPTTNIYWLKMNLTPGAHYIESATKIGGYVAGFKSYYTYGWPIVMGVNKIDKYDIFPPQLTKTGDCGVCLVKVTENQFGPPESVPRQMDQGISKIVLLSEQSYNFDMSYKSFDPVNAISALDVNFRVVDPESPAKAVYAVLDRAGNMVSDSIVFIPDSLAYKSMKADFGGVRIAGQKTMNFSIKNLNFDRSVEIDTIFLKHTGKFSLPDPGIIKGTFIQPGAEFGINVNYSPNKETNGTPDRDTLVVATRCLSYNLPLMGNGIAPHIMVTDYDFGRVKIDSLLCLEDLNGKGLRIENSGKDTLLVTNIAALSEPFNINNPTPLFPFIVEPGGFINFKSVCFLPRDTGSYTSDILISSDAISGDSIGVLKGISYQKPADTVSVDNTGIIQEDNLFVKPNPSDLDETNIIFKIGNYCDVKIDLYDNTGSWVMNVASGYFDKSEYSFKLNSSRLSEGIYFIRMHSRGKIFKKTLFLLK